MKKAGRNDPCPCGSGKKFKKCCESKMLGGRYMATKVDLEASQQVKKTVGMASFFQERLSLTPKKPMPVELISPEPVELAPPKLVEPVQENLAEKETIC